MEPTKNNLDTLRILFIIKGVLTIAASFLFLVFILAAGGMASGELANEDIPFDPTTLFAVIGVAGFLITLSFGIFTLIAAKHIKNRTKHTFIIVVSILNCLTGLLGLGLGIFALIELSNEKVKSLFSDKPVNVLV